MSRRLHLVILLGVTLGLRLLAWRLLPYHDFISDEAEYLAAASWLAQGRGFSYFDGWIWTRPPLYVLFLAAHIFAAGPTALWAPRLTQALLSVLLVFLTVRLGERLAGSHGAGLGEQRPGLSASPGLLAGWGMALSYTFASFAYLLLSETVFLSLFLAALLALLRWAQTQQRAAPTAVSGYLLSQRWLVFAGVLLGLSALTKALVLAWLPLAVLWVAWIGARRQRAGFSPAAGLAGAALLTVAVCAVVLPWSAYATARWGGGDGIILVDTTGGYNFALAAQTGRFGARDEKKLHDTLCEGTSCSQAPTSHAARQRNAYALGWEWISQRPGGFIAKTLHELLDMLQLRYGGAERLNDGYALGEVPLPHLLGLLWDDTLYVVVLPLACLGLLRRQGGRGKALMTGWLLYNVLLGALIFAINRFRVPLLPFLFIYAALAVAQWRRPWLSAMRRRTAYTLALLALLVVLPSYVYWPAFLEQGRRATLQDTYHALQGLRDRAECERAAAALERGAVDEARRLHDQASARKPRPRPCLALLNARLLEAEGKIDGPQGALAFMARAAPPDNLAQASRILMLEGDLLRRLGREEAAIDRFVPRQVEIMNDHRWAWKHLQPPSTRRIDVGAGLDYGYLLGFYKREGRAEDPGNFRWSGPRSAIRFPGAGTGAPQTLVMRVNGYTEDAQPTTITVRPEGGSARSLSLEPQWREISVPLPAAPQGQDIVIHFESSVFVPGPSDLAERVRSINPRPLRFLGFQLDWAQLK